MTVNTEQHICRSRECFRAHARNEDGSSRCLWASRDGIKPRAKGHQDGKWMCSQPSRMHVYQEEPTPHTFTLRYRPRVFTKSMLLHVILPSMAGGVLAGVVIGVVLRLVS